MEPAIKTSLTNREKEILQLILNDLSNKDIAEKIGLSLNTVITHRKNIMKKTESNTIIRLIKWSIKNNFLF